MSDEPPLVSIVTPTFNSAAFIEEHLDSVDAQTYPHVEHVFVDGASTDGTVELIKEYAATHNVRWVSEPDSGNIEATSKGLRMATGEVVVIVPSDDLLFPWSVQTAVEYLQKHPEVDVVHGDSLRRDAERKTWHVQLHKPFSFGYVARTECLTPQAAYFRRRALAGKMDLDPSLRHACDYEWLLRVIRDRRVVNLPEVLATVRKREGAVNREAGVAEAMARETAEVRAKYVDLGGPLNRLVQFWDRLSGALWRRALLSRMLYHSRRIDRGNAPPADHIPWRRFLSTHTVSAGPSRTLRSVVLPNRKTYGVEIRPRSQASRQAG